MYPARCAGCGGVASLPRGGARSGAAESAEDGLEPAPAAARGFCRACGLDVVVLGPPGCGRCGRPGIGRVERCRDCPPEPLSWSRSALLYAGPVRAALMRVKFSGWRGVVPAFAPAIADAARAAPIRTIRPMLTWVPLGRRRKRTRGFDQAQALARALGSEVGWPVGRYLARVRETDPQARQGGVARRQALFGAFVAVARPPPLVIVVDDVLTTGATAAACAEVLIEAGARSVGLVTLARALGSFAQLDPGARGGPAARSSSVARTVVERTARGAPHTEGGDRGGSGPQG